MYFNVVLWIGKVFKVGGIFLFSWLLFNNLFYLWGVWVFKN